MEDGRGNIGQPFVVTAATTELSRNLDDYPEGIVLPIDKPYRWTSADVIRKLKYAAIRHFGRKNLKIGHAGTLDPLATGILIVCIGRATKLAQGLMDHDKEYVASVCFGATTPSYDLEKEFDRFFPYEHITEALLREKLAGFVGEQEQVAPLFSAKSIDGVRAYEHARRLFKRQTGQGSGVSGDLAVQGGETSDDVQSLDGENVFDAIAGELIRTAHIRINEAELLSFRPAGKGVSGSEGCGLNGVGDSENINSEEVSLEKNMGDFRSDFDSGGGEVSKEVGSENLGDSRDDFNSGSGEVSNEGGLNVINSKKVGSGNVGGSRCEIVSEDGDDFSSGVSGRTEPPATLRGASSRIHVATTAGHLPYAEIRLACSKGTYVRAFARDLGEALASGAHLTSLRRTASGPFTVASAVPLPLALSLLA